MFGSRRALDGPFLLVLLLLSVCGCVSGNCPRAAVPLPGQGLEQGLFALNEMDMHLHAGMERQVPLDQWLNLCAADGRKVVIALDHRELYDQTQQEFDAWIAKDKLPGWYPPGKAGKKALMFDLAAQSKRTDLIVFRGWEIYEGELDEGLDRDGMRLAEVIGWHISANGDPPPGGQMLLKRVRQIIEVQKEFPVPMIIFHPFPFAIERVQKDARKQGKDLSSLTVSDYRFFKPGEQEELVRLLRGTSIYIEISLDQAQYMDNPVTREALIADIKPLAEAGGQFTVSTDAHYLEHIRKHFDPERYCSPIGVTQLNTNTIVRELLAIRAKRLESSGPASVQK